MKLAIVIINIILILRNIYSAIKVYYNWELINVTTIINAIWLLVITIYFC